MLNTYEFHYTDTTTGSLWGSVIEAATPRDAWALFEADHPPRRYLVTRMALFWDGATNQRVTRYYDPTTFVS